MYVFFVILYAILAGRGYQLHTTWVFDGIFAVVLITVAFLLSPVLKFGKTEFTLINLGMIVHLLGFFGAYGWTAKFIAYDNLVHLFNGVVLAYLVFNYIVRTFESKKEVRKVFDAHIKTVIFLVIAMAIVVSISVEMTEFFGFLFLGEGDGLFFTGSGDADGTSIYGNYIDAMDDILSNIVGATLGAFVYYVLQYRKLTRRT
jgi:uncharacterized membrane protein YjdF